jgi:hypothetical protein
MWHSTDIKDRHRQTLLSVLTAVPDIDSSENRETREAPGGRDLFGLKTAFGQTAGLLVRDSVR